MHPNAWISQILSGAVVGPGQLSCIAMMSYFRFYFVAFLCIAAGLGHAPAWAHVATCNECVGQGLVGREFNGREFIGREFIGREFIGREFNGRGPQQPASCDHCCHHHENRLADADAGDEPQHTPHDSDSCAVCQSLACPVGTNWAQFTIRISRVAPQRIGFFSVSRTHQPRESDSSPRGPPCAGYPLYLQPFVMPVA